MTCDCYYYCYCYCSSVSETRIQNEHILQTPTYSFDRICVTAQARAKSYECARRFNILTMLRDELTEWLPNFQFKSSVRAVPHAWCSVAVLVLVRIQTLGYFRLGEEKKTYISISINERFAAIRHEKLHMFLSFAVYTQCIYARKNSDAQALIGKWASCIDFYCWHFVFHTQTARTRMKSKTESAYCIYIYKLIKKLHAFCRTKEEKCLCATTNICIFTGIQLWIPELP